MYNPFFGTEQTGVGTGGGYQSPSIPGLPSQNFSYTPGTSYSTGGYTGIGGTFPGSTVETPGYTSYTDPTSGQQFKRTASGSWQTGGGYGGIGARNIQDLPGYLQMRGLQKSGADFTGYQNQLNQLLQDPSKIQQTPAYQFALQQGNEAINRSAAAKGMLGSGNVLAELAKYGQGMASQEYGTQVNRLADLMKGSQQFGMGAGYYSPMAPTQQAGAWG